MRRAAGDEWSVVGCRGGRGIAVGDVRRARGRDQQRRLPDLERARGVADQVVARRRTMAAGRVGADVVSSEERRVGKERRSRWSPYHYKKEMVVARGHGRSGIAV